MSPRDIDWDAELAKVDRAIAASGGAPAPVPAPAGKAQPAGPQRSSGAAQAVAGRREVMLTWVRLVLALGLGAGMTQWPYLHGCGVSLFAYLGAVGAVMVASTWSLISSWRTRSALAHTISIILLFWGMALAAREVLPRMGYAKQAATWTCTTK